MAYTTQKYIARMARIDSIRARVKPQRLFGTQNAKTSKGEFLGILTAIIYLAPANESGVMNVCTSATIWCIAACLYKAGRGIFPATVRARIDKTRFLARDRVAFVAQAKEELTRLVKRARKMGLKLAVRVNGTSDLPWLAQELARAFPEVQFYDYTKHRNPWLRELANYRLTFSYSGENLGDSLAALQHGCNVAVVFTTKKGAALPAEWHGYPVIDADVHDVRFLDPIGVVCGLRAKGPAKKQVDSPFVVLAA